MLVFESGMWDCDAMNAHLGDEAPVIKIAQRGVFPWRSESEQCRAAFQCAIDAHHTERPLVMAGCDSQLSGLAGRSDAKDLLAELERVPGAKLDAAVNDAFVQLHSRVLQSRMMGGPAPAAEETVAIDALERAITAEGAPFEKALGARPFGYAPCTAKWAGVCDAFLFTDRMFKSTRASEKDE